MIPAAIVGVGFATHVVVLIDISRVVAPVTVPVAAVSEASLGCGILTSGLRPRHTATWIKAIFHITHEPPITILNG
jgi:hypothetical protein